MAAELDIRFENEIAASLPALVVNPSKELEEAGAARDAPRGPARRRERNRGGGRAARARWRLPCSAGRRSCRTPSAGSTRRTAARCRCARCAAGSSCSTSGPTPASTASGRCRRSRRGTAATAREGLTIIGLHAPEFPFERDAGNVERAIARNGLRYPVAQDNDFATWRAYGNQYWPAKYLIDARGRVRYVHFGEGEYDATERAIRRSWPRPGASASAGARARACRDAGGAWRRPSPTSAPSARQRFLNGAIGSGRHDFELPRRRASPRCRRTTSPTRAPGASTRRTRPRRASGARLHLRFSASRVFLVLGARGRPRSVRDRRSTARRRRDAHGHRDTASTTSCALPRPGDHLLTLTLGPGTEAYAFTFG